MARPSEDELIARYLAPLAGPGGLGLRDDAALLAPTPGHELVLTVDAIVEGVHFLPGDPPASIAAKALGVNLSDLAAKGAEPVGFLLVLGLPDGWTEDWLAAFCGGLGEAAVSCRLLGGDTVRAAGPLTISVTALGEVPAGTMVRRTTAQPGDLVAVTGTIGDAALGLALLLRGEKEHQEGVPGDWRTSLSPDHRAYLIDRYRVPRPRLALAAALREHASAAMDVSDGLVGDLAKMLRASGMEARGVTGTLDLDRIPLSSAARAALASEASVIASALKQPGGPVPAAAEDWIASSASPSRNDGQASLLDRIAGGGDDYEILFTLPPGRWEAMREAAAACGLAVTALGEVRAGTEPLRVTRGSSPYATARTSFQHFGTAAR